jgi:hypothetical protein
MRSIDLPSKEFFVRFLNNLKLLKNNDDITFQLNLDLLEFAMQDTLAKSLRHYVIDLDFGTKKSKFLIDISSPFRLYDFLAETTGYKRIKNVSPCPFCERTMDINMHTRILYCEKCGICYQNNLLFIDDLIREWNKFAKKHKKPA